MMDAVLEYLCE